MTNSGARKHLDADQIHDARYASRAGNRTAGEILTPEFGGVPIPLQEANQWVLWKTDTREGKATKVPVSVFGQPASSTNAGTWASFENVVTKFDESHHSGIGFVFSADDKFVGIDLDGCRDPESGTVADWALDEVQRFNSYTEVSPSQTGLKIWIQADSRLPKGRNKKLPFPEIVPKSPGVEVYSHGRFFAVTGHVFKNHSEIQHREAELQAFLAHHWQVAADATSIQPDWRSDDAVVERARKYVATMPGAVAGARGHDATFHAACVLVKGFELNSDQAFGVLSEWNVKCEPPWFESELRRKISEAGKSTGETGYLRNARPERWPEITVPQTLAQPNVNGHGHVSLLSAKQSAATPEPAPRSFAGKSAAELWDLADQPVQWLVNGVLSCDQPTIFGAKQKSLKTTLLTDLAVSLASGYAWLGQFEIPRKRRILFVTGEASEAAAIRKVRRAAESRNLCREDFTDSLRLEAMTFPTLPVLADCLAVGAAVKEHGIEVVLLDPLYMGLQGLNTANLTEVGPAMRQFMEHCRPANVIIAHHVKKTASFDDAPNLEDLSQAGIAEFAGNYWLMGRMSEYTGDGMHQLAVRYGGRDEQFGLLKLDFDERNWRAEFTSLIDHREDLKRRQETERVNRHMALVKGHLSRHGGEASLAKLAEAAGTKTTREPFQRLIDELCDSGPYERFEMKSTNNRWCEALRVKRQISKDSVQ